MQPVVQCRDSVVEIRADSVHFVDEDDARDSVVSGLSPNLHGLRLHPSYGVEYDYHAVKHPQAAFDLGREVDMPWRID